MTSSRVSPPPSLDVWPAPWSASVALRSPREMSMPSHGRYPFRNAFLRFLADLDSSLGISGFRRWHMNCASIPGQSSMPCVLRREFGYEFAMCQLNPTRRHDGEPPWWLASRSLSSLEPRRPSKVSAARRAGSSRSDSTSYPHGEYEEDCILCHSPSAWKPVVISKRFKHEHSGFALDGAHESTSCRACHLSLEFSDADGKCVSCHLDVHRANWGRIARPVTTRLISWIAPARCAITIRRASL